MWNTALASSGTFATLASVLGEPVIDLIELYRMPDSTSALKYLENWYPPAALIRRPASYSTWIPDLGTKNSFTSVLCAISGPMPPRKYNPCAPAPLLSARTEISGRKPATDQTLSQTIDRQLVRI